MKVSGTLALAVALGVAALPTPAVAQEAERSGPGITQVVPSAPAAEPGVRVVRGTGVQRPDYRSSGPRPAKVVPSAEIAAGDTVWLVDRKANRLAGCYLASTGQAGHPPVIRCTTRRLP
ncbi:MAG: hypothetical protein HKM95_05815 [Inquilinus sp.]|nr:hypothetical protein [Inquilinus sp.]